MSLNFGVFGVKPEDEEERIKDFVCFIDYSERFCFCYAESERVKTCFFSAIGVFFVFYIL